MHRKHGIHRGTEVTEGRGAWRVSQWVGIWGAPPPDKLQRTSNTIVGLLPLIFGIWFGKTPKFGVFLICTARRPMPIQLQSVSHPTSRLWTVGIASVGTVSVGIVWCTPRL